MKNNETHNNKDSFFEKSKLPKEEWPAEWDDFDKEAAEGLSMLNEKGILNKVDNKIDEILNENKKPRTLYYFIAAAASIVVVFCFYFLMNFKNESQLVQNFEKNEIKESMPSSEITKDDKGGSALQSNLTDTKKETESTGNMQMSPGAKKSDETVSRSNNDYKPAEESLNEATAFGNTASIEANKNKSDDLKDANGEGAMDELSKAEVSQTVASSPPAPTTVSEKEEKPELEETKTKSTTQQSFSGDKVESKKKAEKRNEITILDNMAGAASAPAQNEPDADQKNLDDGNKELAQFILKSEPELKNVQIELVLNYGDDLLLKEVQFKKWPNGYKDLKERVKKFLQENKSYYNGQGQILNNKKERVIRMKINDNG